MERCKDVLIQSVLSIGLKARQFMYFVIGDLEIDEAAGMHVNCQLRSPVLARSWLLVPPHHQQTIP